MANQNPQVDVTPASGPAGLNLHFHGPAGNSASAYNANTDFPAPPKSGTAVVVKINGTPGSQVRFANPS
ncbi:MAG: hypothetical protein DMG96_27920 [Acidobacteria bacterium]|nr:MAG: hypothetical protein DMG96_27920 [Acidobacteriota bacterium]